jgi:hypothetical protein
LQPVDVLLGSQIDLPNPLGGSICQIDLLICQIELPNRQSEFESPNQFGLPNRIGDSNFNRFGKSICLIDLPNPLGKSIWRFGTYQQFDSIWRFDLSNRFAGSILQIDLPDPFSG